MGSWRPTMVKRNRKKNQMRVEEGIQERDKENQRKPITDGLCISLLKVSEHNRVKVYTGLHSVGKSTSSALCISWVRTAKKTADMRTSLLQSRLACASGAEQPILLLPSDGQPRVSSLPVSRWWLCNSKPAAASSPRRCSSVLRPWCAAMVVISTGQPSLCTDPSSFHRQEAGGFSLLRGLLFRGQAFSNLLVEGSRPRPTFRTQGPTLLASSPRET